MIRRATVGRSARSKILVSVAAGLTVTLSPSPLPEPTTRVHLSPPAVLVSPLLPQIEAGPGTSELSVGVLALEVSAQEPSLAPMSIVVRAAAVDSAPLVAAPLLSATAFVVAGSASVVVVAGSPSVKAGASEVETSAVSLRPNVSSPTVAALRAQVSPPPAQSSAEVGSPTVLGAQFVAPGSATTLALAAPPAISARLVSVSPQAAAHQSTLASPSVVLVSGYDADAQAYFNAMTVQPSDTVKTRVSDFIAGLKTDGLWSLIEWISLRALHDTQSARLDMRNPSRSSAISGAPSFTPGKGFMGDGSSYLGTGINNTGAVLFMQDSATLFSFVNVSGNGPLVGASSNTFLRTGNTNTQDGRVNSATNTSITNAPGPLGFAAVSRLNATTQRHFRNGQQIGTGSAASASAAMNEIRFYQASGIGTFAGRSALEGFGAGMTDAQIASLNARVQTLINAIGAS